MDTHMIAFSGKLSSGKTSCANLLHALAFMNIIRDKDGNLLTSRAWVNPEGKLMLAASETEDAEFNLDSKHPEVVQWLAENVHPYIKKFSHADKLKKFCVDVLNLNPLHVYGTQADKNELSHIKWEDVPTYSLMKKNKPSGFMTVREVMEYVGTELIRKLYAKAWCKSSIKSVLQYNPWIAVNDDTRFMDEVEAVREAGGKVIRLTRVTEEAAKNTHRSNTDLDNVDPSLFDAVIDNQNNTLEETFSELVKILTEWEWIQPNES